MIKKTMHATDLAQPCMYRGVRVPALEPRHPPYPVKAYQIVNQVNRRMPPLTVTGQ